MDLATSPRMQRMMATMRYVRAHETLSVLVVLVLLPLTACSASSSSSSRLGHFPVSSALQTFCQHINGSLLHAMNAEMDSSPTAIRPVLAAYAAARRDFQDDARAGDPEVRRFATDVIAGIDEVVARIRVTGNLDKAVNGKVAGGGIFGAGPKLTDATLEIGERCSS